MLMFRFSLVHCIFEASGTSHKRTGTQVKPTVRYSLQIVGPLFILLTSVSCKSVAAVKEFFSRDPEATACSEALKTSAAISYGTSLAYSQFYGIKHDNVLVITKTPGFMLCAITIDNSHPLPLGNANFGTILTAAIFCEDSMAVMSVNFANINIREGTFQLKHASVVPVMRSGDSLFTTYISQDINFFQDTANDPVFNQTLTEQQRRESLKKFETKPPADTSAVGVDLSQDVWLSITENGMENRSAGYNYTVFGIGQYLRCAPSEISTIQLALFGTKIGPITNLNPFTGYGILQEIKLGTPNMEMGHAALWFEGKNDGKITVPVATGTYMGASGRRYPLGL